MIWYDCDQEVVIRRDTFFNRVEDYTAFGCTKSNPPFKYSRPGGIESDDYQKDISIYFRNEACLYNHRNFQFAGIIFDVMKHNIDDYTRRPKHSFKKSEGRETPGLDVGTAVVPPRVENQQLPHIEFKSETEKRVTYSLVYQTLKYQRFLQEMLEDAQFFERFPEHSDSFCDVMVILCDFQMRKFQHRMMRSDEEVIAKMSYIEESLFLTKTKLDAALARSRIRARVRSLDYLLPDSIRLNEKIAARMNVCCWINQNRTSVPNFTYAMEKEGFALVESQSELKGKTYMFDRHCYDVVYFPFELRDTFESFPYVLNGHIVIQDKSSSIGPHSIKGLLGEDDDILHVGIGSGIVAAHMASLTANSKTRIFALGIQSEKHHKQILKLLAHLGARPRVKMIGGNFLESNFTDVRLREVKVILVSSNCTKSGVVNPVNFLVTEGEDLWALRDLSLGNSDPGRLHDMTVQHTTLLKQALLMPRAQAVVYVTRSVVDCENESVVLAAIDHVTTARPMRTVFRICPPVLAFDESEIEMENPVVGKYLKYQPSPMTSGCFVAIVTREADDPQIAAKGILARAAAKGIIPGTKDGQLQELDSKKKKKKSKKDRKKKSGGVAETTGNKLKKSKGKKRLSIVEAPQEEDVSNQLSYQLAMLQEESNLQLSLDHRLALLMNPNLVSASAAADQHDISNRAHLDAIHHLNRNDTAALLLHAEACAAIREEGLSRATNYDDNNE